MAQVQARTSALFASLVILFTLLPAIATAQQTGPIAQVSSGFHFSCALTTAGGVACWGKNNVGQLGDNSTMDRRTPVDVVGLTSGVVAISANYDHVCALTTGGGLKCWGGNYNGQLGDNSTFDRYTPVDVFGLTSGVAAIAAGGLHTCALTVAGGVKCWGLGGLLGNGSSSQPNVPVDVNGLASGVTALAAGIFHTCAITTGGGVKCWGSNGFGQLGQPLGTTGAIPVDVAGLSSGVSAIALGGDFTCALTAAGGVKCWGENLRGNLGDGGYADRSVPADVSGLTSGVAAIATGGLHACALTSLGTMKCWGDGNSGELGNNDPGGANQPTPVDVVGLGTSVAAISAGSSHTCALSAGGNLSCWGDNYYGAVGDGSTPFVPHNVPVGVAGLSTTGVASIGLGESHTCALMNAGGVKCWGFNSQGELGNSSTAQSLLPVDVTGLTSGVAAIGASKFHTCAVTTGGAVKCWGQNTSGSLGDGTQTERHFPIDVFGLGSGMASVSLGSNHSCALSTLGAAYCWGGNSLGVAGDGTYNQQLVPVAVLQSTAFTSISAGDTVTCAQVTGGGVQCWGANNAGQLGTGTTLPAKTNIPGGTLLPSTVVAMDAGGSHTCAVSGGVPVCWGSNLSGELGDGTFTSPRASPVNAGSLTGIVAITSGTVHTCALNGAGGVKCWGDNFFGELGDGSGTGRSSPVDVVGLSSGITAIEAGFGHTCAITTAGGVKCWGHNLNGQLGDNSTSDRHAPVAALIGGQSIAFTPPALLLPGVPVTLSATASGGLPVTFDTWTPGTCSIVGNTVTASAAGLCGIRASQAGSADLSAAPQVLRLVAVMTPESIPRLANISTRMQVLTGNDVLIGGFIVGGTVAKTVVVRARGPSLTPLGVPGALADPFLQLFTGQTVIGANDDFGAAGNLAALQASGFAPSDAKESAILATLGPGAYTAIVSGVGGSTGVGIMEIFEVDHPEVPLVNISTRGRVLTGNDVMIGGFIIQGNAPQTVVVRARGPSLAAFGIADPLANPLLQLFSGPNQIAANDDWQTAANAAELSASGFAPGNALESAILITLPPGPYTAIVSGVGGTTGVGIIEVFAQ